MPKVSICIPTYNQTKYLRKTLDSILIQTFRDFEIIITDDTSSSLVKDLIREYAFENKIRYFKNELPLGSPQNWNFCIRKARGQYIKILHHDDLFSSPYSLFEFVNFLDENPEITMAFSSSHALLDNGKNWTHSISKEKFNEVQTNPTILFLENKIGGPSVTIFRKEMNAIFDHRLKWLVDIEFYIISFINYKIGHILNPLISTSDPESRISNSCVNNKQIEIFEHFYLFDKIFNEYPRYKNYGLGQCFLRILWVCDKYTITKISEIRNCDYNGKIHSIIRLHFLLQNLLKKSRFKYFAKRLLIFFIIKIWT